MSAQDKRTTIEQQQLGGRRLEVTVVPAGKRTYLWIGWGDECAGTISDPRALERLARAILAEVAKAAGGKGE